MKNKSLRKERIRSKLAKVKDTLDFISDNLPEKFENFKKNRVLKSGIYKEIEFCIEEVIQICYIINTDLGLGVPEVEDGVFNNLKIKNILPKKTIITIQNMKKFRNILVHKYGDVNDKVAFDNITKGLDNFNDIISEIEEFLRNN